MNRSGSEIKIISGSSHPDLAIAIARNLGTAVSKILCSRLRNHEIVVTVGETVREEDVYIVQTNWSATGSLNDSLFELLQLISACKAGSAAKITAGAKQLG